MPVVEKRLLALLLPAVVVGILLAAPVQAGGRSSAPGDLFVSRMSGGEARVEWYHPDGARNGQLKPPKAQHGGGLGFDSGGNLYVTDPSHGLIVKYDRSGKRVGTFANGLVEPSSIVFDKAGNAFVGQQDEIDVVKLDPQGRRLAVFDLEVVKGGESGQIDLAPDHCTLYYRSGRSIRGFDACQGHQGGDFAELRDEGDDDKGAIRTLPSGGVLVADRGKIIRLDRSGKVVKDYDVAGEDKWYHLALDAVRGGKFFWAAGGETAKVYRFNLRTGGIDRKLSISNVSGLAVRDAPPPPPEPAPATSSRAEGSEREPAKTLKVEASERDAAKTLKVEGSEEGTESDDVPTAATLPFAAPATSPASPVGGGGDQAVARATALAPSSGQGANLSKAQPVRSLSDVARARAQVPAPTSDTAAVSGDRGVSQLDLISAEPHAQPQTPAPPMVASEAAPRAPFVQAQAEPPLQGRMKTERYERLMASGRKADDRGWPFVVGTAAVMLFAAALAGRRRA